MHRLPALLLPCALALGAAATQPGLAAAEAEEAEATAEEAAATETETPGAEAAATTAEAAGDDEAEAVAEEAEDVAEEGDDAAAAGDEEVDPAAEEAAQIERLSYLVGYQRLHNAAAQMALVPELVAQGLRDAVADADPALELEPERMQQEFQQWQFAIAGGSPPEEAPGESPETWNLQQRVSYLFGHLPVYSTVAAAEFDAEALIDGMLAQAAGEEAAHTTEDLEADIMAWEAVLDERRARRAEVNAVVAAEYFADKATEEGVESTARGVLYEVLEPGDEDGASPDANDRVVAHYTGRLLDGEVFDSSEERGEPATFALNEVIPGWTEALQLMRTGARWRLHIPPQLAYGPEGRPGSIPPNATLIFEVELLEVEEVLSGEQYLERVAEREGVVTTDSGLRYEVLAQGDGPTPAANDTVRVHYSGQLVDGTVFDSSRERGQPASFRVDQVIPGWTEGLQLMPVGSTYRLHIPSDLAYGPAGRPPTIPPNSVLVFEVELLGIE